MMSYIHKCGLIAVLSPPPPGGWVSSLKTFQLLNAFCVFAICVWTTASPSSLERYTTAVYDAEFILKCLSTTFEQVRKSTSYPRLQYFFQDDIPWDLRPFRSSCVRQPVPLIVVVNFLFLYNLFSKLKSNDCGPQRYSSVLETICSLVLKWSYRSYGVYVCDIHTPHTTYPVSSYRLHTTKIISIDASSWERDRTLVVISCFNNTRN